MSSPHQYFRWKAAGIKTGIIASLGVFGFLILIATIHTTACGCMTKTDDARVFVSQTIQTAIRRYKDVIGNYPSHTEGLAALLKAPAKTTYIWKGPYLDFSPLDKFPLDPWGHEYFYRQPGTHNPERYDFFSAGPDGKEGTADDIGNW